MKAKDAFLKEIKENGNAKIAEHAKGYFKTGKGQYGEGDIFWGLKVPLQRTIAKKHKDSLSLEDIDFLMRHKVHEVRLASLLVLVAKYKKASDKQKKDIADLYFSNASFINNWDLVDLTAPIIAGDFWFNNGVKTMFDFAKSGNLWKERIALISNQYFIRQGRYDEIIKLCEYFLNHKHDLIHKASGWMLREVGKIVDTKILRQFLDKHSKEMPRTMLRYAIEKLSDKERKRYMVK